MLTASPVIYLTSQPLKDQRVSPNTVPCPLCCNSQTPGQLDQPRQGWSRGEFPEHLMSVPCPLCAGIGTIPQEEWDKMSRQRPRAEASEKKKKQEASEKIGPGIFEGMKAAREQREKDWLELGPFKISDFRKAE